AGVLWVNKNPLELANFHFGLPYAVGLLTILTAHEFGHYFAARAHGVDTTLPFYIPFPPFILSPFGGGELIQLNPFGTMGAVIRIRSPLTSTKALFDIGIAGPIAGFIPTVAILIAGLITLPGKEYLYSVHPEYRFLSTIPKEGLTFGNSILFWGIRKLLPTTVFFPPMNEIYHYPFLCVAWFGMFVTALNMIPVGQLDGGHILYALIGKRQWMVANVFWGILVVLGISSLLPFIGIKTQIGTTGWIVWAAILYFVIKLHHPQVSDESPLTRNRIMLGWASFLIFVLIFPPVPIFDAL
ncbi:MAG TPA: site-2 protease family protein, partial [Bacteroidota bacterium]|nr:site-2 protease family protein [Bacteroidota bacterium]